MGKAETFFRAMAWLCLGVIIGFFIAPMKQGVNVSICSNNTDTAFGCEGDADDDEEPEELVLE
ncbi:MAG: hypothetical protein Q4D42_00870 [Eubacteriales bacterium]|nr:hypothetical protein [Eubacteriales bacterium]